MAQPRHIPTVGTVDPLYQGRRFFTDYCRMPVSSTGPYVCSYKAGHQGIHVAHRDDGKVLAVLHPDMMLPEGL